jgi:predicted ABC-type ATPase
VTLDQSAIDAHRNSVRAMAKPGQALAPDSPNATINNPAWFRHTSKGVERRAVRIRLHDQLKAQYVDAHPGVLQDRRAVVLAGPPGAGKSTALGTVLGESVKEYLTVDADEFKRALLDTAIQDGSYASHIVPDAVAARERTGEQFFPLELSSLVHEESSMLAKQLRSEAIERGDNVIIDTVLSSADSALALGAQLEAAGYSIDVIDVEVPYSLSEQRIATRWQESYEAAVEHGHGLGGRWVPSEYAREVFDGPDGKSRPEAAAQRLATECGAVNRFRRFRTVLDENGAAVGPTLELDLAREATDKPLIPASTTIFAKAAAARDFARSQFRPPARTQQRQPPRMQPGRNQAGKPGRNLGPSPER